MAEKAEREDIREHHRYECDKCGATVSTNYDATGRACYQDGCDGKAKLKPYVYNGHLAALRLLQYGGYPHYHTAIIFRGARITVDRKLTSEEARKWNRHYGTTRDEYGRYSKGDVSDKYDTKEQAVRMAVALFNRELKPEGALFLLEGMSISEVALNPSPVLAFDESVRELAERLIKLEKKFTLNDDYEGPLGDELGEEWQGLLKPYEGTDE